jgi:rhodanese-related sulfurtransferase
MRQFTPTQLRERLEQNGEQPLLLDVREPWEFNLCAIENSQLIPMGEIAARIDSLDPEKETVVICHHGIRSRSVAMYMERHGFNDVINLSGGVEAWSREVDLDMPTY